MGRIRVWSYNCAHSCAQLYSCMEHGIHIVYGTGCIFVSFQRLSHGQCWGLHTKRHPPPSFKQAAMFPLSLSLLANYSDRVGIVLEIVLGDRAPAV